MTLARRPLLTALLTAAVTAAVIGAFAATATLPTLVRAQTAEATKKNLVVGTTAGPYADQIKLGIKPILEKKGYTVKVVEFNDYVQPNHALAQGSLDANVFQHSVYLARFAAEHQLALSEVIKVPTAPIAIYSKKHRSLAEVAEGASVALPNDPTNAARALVLLQQIGWVRLKDHYDPIRVSERDVTQNPKKLRLLALEAAQLPRSLADTDYAFVNGNFALASGLKLTEALAVETTSPAYQNLVAVRTADKDQPWVKDFADAYRSREFLALTEARFPGFVKPDYQQALSVAAAK